MNYCYLPTMRWLEKWEVTVASTSCTHTLVDDAFAVEPARPSIHVFTAGATTKEGTIFQLRHVFIKTAM
ncbi:MAG: hypothetical protein IPP69_08620 [Flavobacteriales bacterium]|nr:hypothetical protein [Flavobacteriales bacterium]